VRAFVVSAPGEGGVRRVPPPVAGAGEVLVDVERVGVCGTDVELFRGEMQYLEQGLASFPLRPGHEWAGTVALVGHDVDPALLGRRITGDTMIGCGACARCRGGRHHVCDDRSEIGIRGSMPGALAERLAVPARAARPLPDGMDPAVGALVEPGGIAVRAVRAARLSPGERVLILGPGTIGLLAGLVAAARGAEVHLLGKPEDVAVARGMGFQWVWTLEDLPALRWDAVIDTSNDPSLPALAVSLVEPGRTVVFVGLAGTASTLDTRELALADVTAVGVLGASAGLAEAIALYADGRVDPRPLVAATVGLTEVAGVLGGVRPAGAGPGPKIHIDPRQGAC
jgi:threonine dehydrogenase-like Zn-dependent dehydrogenase